MRQGREVQGQSAPPRGDVRRTLPTTPGPRAGARGAAAGCSGGRSIDDAIEVAASILALANLGRGVLHSESDQRRVQLERAAIAAAAHGLVEGADRVPVEAFEGAPRLLAWTCAARAGRILGRRSSIFAARYVLVTMPRLELPLDVWAALHRDTHDELDEAEALPAARDAIEALMAEYRAGATLAALRPVLSALDRGSPLPDTPARLRDAAALFEGAA